MTGTSMAAAHVTGAAALYASRFPGASAKDIRAALLSSTTGTASLQGKTSTGGRLNVADALGVSSTPPALPAAPSDLTAQLDPATGEVMLTWQDHSTNELASSF